VHVPKLIVCLVALVFLLSFATMLIVLNMNRYFDISLIIPTYNRSSLLKYTMESLLQQNYNLDRIQVIVSDDGSSDDTADML
jgi:cellulose synthase/poly-beta-1,6-N-acetylglucosamine synthase-like glycosyltransferase